MSRAIPRNFLFIAASNLLAPLFSIFLVLAIGRLQGVEALGKYSLLMTVFIFGMSVASFGLPVVVTREVAQAPLAAGRWFLHAGALSVGLLLPIVLLAVGACFLGARDHEMGLALGLTMLTVLPSAVTQQAEAVLLALERAQDFVFINLGETALRAAFGTALIVGGAGVVGIAVLLLLLRLGSALVFVLALRRRGVRGGGPFDRRLLWDLAGYVPVTGLIPVVNALYARADVFALSSLGSWRDLGVYSAALRLVDLARTVPLAYARAVYPMLARVRDQGTVEYAAVAGRVVRNGLLLAVPLALGLCGLAEPVVRLLFGEELAPAATLMAALAWMVVPSALAFVLAQVLFAADRQAVDLGVNLISMAVSIGGAVVLVPRFGAAGAVAATLTASTLYAVLQYAGVVRCVTRPAAGLDVLRLAAATAGAMLVLHSLAGAGAIVATTSALAVYAGLCVGLGLRPPLPGVLRPIRSRRAVRAREEVQP